MSLRDSKNSLLAYAKLLPDKYENYSINYLADKYCEAKDAGDEEEVNIYCSALMLRFWYTINKMYQKCKTAGVERDDLFMTLYSCIDNACSYRAWQDPTKHTNAQACINQSIATRGAAAIMYDANRQKAKLNTPANIVSLDDEAKDTKDGTTSLELLADDRDVESDDYKVYSIIQDLLNNNKVVEAIIVDNIAYKDVFKHEKRKVSYMDDEGIEQKYTEHTSQFWEFKLVQELGNLDSEYTKAFMATYSVERPQFDAAVSAISKANNQKKYKMVDATLKGLRADYEVWKTK